MSDGPAPAPLGRALRLTAAGGVRWLWAHMLLVFLQGVLPLAGLYLMKLLVDAIAAGIGAPDPLAAFEGVLWIVALAAGVALSGLLLGSFGTYVAEAHGRTVGDAVLHRLHGQSVKLDLSYYDDPEYHDTLHRAQQEAPTRPVRIVQELAGLGRASVTLAGMAGLLVALHWALPLVVVIAAVPAVLVRMRFARLLFRWQQEHAEDQRMSAYLSALMTGRGAAKEVRLFDLGGGLAERFDGLRDELRGQALSLAARRARADLLAQSLTSIVLFAAYAWLAWLTLGGITTLGDLVMYAQAIQRSQGAVQAVLGALAGLQEHRMFLSHFDEFLGLRDRITAPAEPRELPSPLGEGIRCEDLWFRYPQQSEPVLKGVDFELAPGEHVALVGPNGAGKSTLVKLLCRLYDPEKGRVSCDGIDLRELDPAAWRRRLSVLFQDAMPFEFTARENVLASDPDGDARAAAELAGVAERLDRLPRGMDTVLGRRFRGGEELSVGEWRKLLLARSLNRNADVLVLDEPSASLDPRAEVEILERLHTAARDKGVLVVTHRPAALASMDRICVMQDGRVVEVGTHDSLLARGGTYARLFGGRP